MSVNIRRCRLFLCVLLFASLILSIGSQFNCTTTENFACLFQNVQIKSESDLEKAVFFAENHEGKVFGFSMSFISIFPKKLMDSFNSIEVLVADDSGIKRIPGNAFENAKSLKKLFLHDNQLNVLKNDVFNGAHSLELLALQNNSIHNIEENVFSGLRNLKELTMEGNLIEKLHPKLFAGLTNLQVLNLGNNKISKISGITFSENSNLEAIVLDSNLIEVLPENLFSGLVMLKKVYLESNSIKRLPATMFTGLFRLEAIMLQENQISDMGDSVFIDNVALIDLNMSMNHLRGRINAEQFANLTKLLNFDLSGNMLEACVVPAHGNNIFLENNRISSLNKSDFNHVKEIKSLSLNNNSLIDLQEGAFDDLRTLKELYLDDNRIERLPPKLFSRLRHLKSLHLQGNKITEIDDKQFENNLALVDLNMTCNHLYKFDMRQLLPLENLYLFDVSNNNLETLMISEHMGSLNASFNPISTVIFDDGKSFELVALQLTNTKVTDVTGFTKLTKLQYFDLPQSGTLTLPFHVFASIKELKKLNPLKQWSSNETITFDIIGNNLDSNLFPDFPLVEIIRSSGNMLLEVNVENAQQIFVNISYVPVDDDKWNCEKFLKIIETYGDTHWMLFLSDNENCINETDVSLPCCSEVKPSPLKQKNMNTMKEANRIEKKIEKLDKDITNLKTEIENLEKDERFKKAFPNESDGEIYTRLSGLQRYLEDENKKYQEQIKKLDTELEKKRTNSNNAVLENNRVQRVKLGKPL